MASASLVVNFPYLRFCFLFFCNFLQTFIWVRMLSLKLCHLQCWLIVALVQSIHGCSIYVLYKFNLYFCSILIIPIDSSLHIFHPYYHSASTKRFSMVVYMFCLDTTSLYFLWDFCIIWYIYVNVSPSYLLTQ